jgi:hypothetical protein
MTFIVYRNIAHIVKIFFKMGKNFKWGDTNTRMSDSSHLVAGVEPSCDAS